MSKDKQKRKTRAYAMIREMNREGFFCGTYHPRPWEISRRPGPDLAYAIRRGMVSLRRVVKSRNVSRTVVDTGFWPFR